MEPKAKSPAMILGIVGGALLVVGSLLTWATFELDIAKFAELIGVEPGLLSQGGVTPTTEASGISSNAGKIALVAGILVVVFAVMLATAKTASKAPGVVMVIAGAVASAAIILNLSTKDTQIDNELDKLGPELSQLGTTAEGLKSVFEIKWGIGIYVALAGGLVAIVAGIMALAAKRPAIAETTSAAPVAAGFGAPSVSPGTAPPGSVPPASPTPPLPPEEPPATAP